MSRVVNVVNGAASRWSAPSVRLPLVGAVRLRVGGSSLAPTEAGNSSRTFGLLREFAKGVK